MCNQNIWYEILYQKFGQFFYTDKIIYKANTKHQELIIFENTLLGRIMALNGIVQTTEYDEFIYHEMMVHVPIIAHGKVKKVLIIGGGDGGVLREINYHTNIQEITMVEIDEDVINCCKKYLPHHSKGAFNSPYYTLIIDDGMEFLNKTIDNYDVIISDCTDPIGPGLSLFTSNFYQNCANHLNDDGIFVAQNGVFPLQQEELIDSYCKLRRYFNDVGFYHAPIPTYYGGPMAFAWATQNSKLRQLDTEIIAERIKELGLTTCRYYNANIHNSSFSLPQYILDALSRYN